MRYECYANETSVTRVKNFDFDNDTSKNIFSHLYIYYMASERLQGEEQFRSKNYLLETPRFHAKDAFENRATKTELFNGKRYIKKLYIRLSLSFDAHARSCIATHSNAVSFLIKGILCENTNILFSRNC